MLGKKLLYILIIFSTVSAPKDGKRQAIVRPLQAMVKMEPPASQQEILALMAATSGRPM